MFKTQAQRTLEASLARQRTEREEREQREVDEQAERERRNAESRKVYLDGLAAKREGERQKMEAEVDAALEPEKQRARNEWLAAHPYHNHGDFEKTWTQFLRPNAVENLERAKGEQVRARLRASGKYSF